MTSRDDEIAQNTRAAMALPIVDPKRAARAQGKTLPSVEDQAASLYYACHEFNVVPRGDQWDVHDGPNGPLVGTVDVAVLIELDDNYDQPVQTADGSEWDPRRS